MPNDVALLEAVPHYPEADSFDFRKSWAGLRHACGAHKLLILCTCLFTISLVVAYIRIFPPVFVAQVELVGESDKDHERESFYGTWAVFRNDQLSDEVNLLTSPPVLEEVIARLRLTDADVYHTIFSYAGYLWTTSWVGKTYRSAKAWMFPPVRGPYDATEEQIDAARTLQDFKTGVQFERLMETDIGSLVVRGPSPRVAQIANTIVQVYFEQRRARHIAEAQSAYSALNEELQKAQADVDKIEEDMRAYYAKSGLLLVFEKDKVDIGQAQALKAAIVELSSGIAANSEILRETEAALSQEAREVVSSRVDVANPLRDNLKAQLATLQIQRKQTLMNYLPNSREVSDLDRQIGILNEQLKQAPSSTVGQTTTVLSSHYEELRGQADTLRAQLAGQRANLAAKQLVYDQLESELRTIPEKMQMVHVLEREHGANEKKLEVIREKMMIASVSLATARTAYSSIRVVTPAAASSEASWPKTKLLLAIATVVGLVAGVLLVLLMDLFFGRVHRFRLASAGRDLPIYAIVQRDGASARTLFALTAADGPDRRRLAWSRNQTPR
jgi:uncharacterized protein involved in exopolysaccharide biosynthesis